MPDQHLCSVKGCRKKKEPGKILHRFPPRQKLLSLWMKLCGVTKLGARSAVCSDHFEDNQYRAFSKRKMLIDGAVPSLNLPVRAVKRHADGSFSSASSTQPLVEIDRKLEKVVRRPPPGSQYVPRPPGFPSPIVIDVPIPAKPSPIKATNKRLRMIDTVEEIEAPLLPQPPTTVRGLPVTDLLELQLGIYSQPSYNFTESEKMEFVDAIGDVLFDLPEDAVMPKFKSTSRRDCYIIVTAADKRSLRWLTKIVPELQVWENTKLFTIPMGDLRSIRKGTLKLCGRHKYSEHDLLKRIERQNPNLDPTGWRVFSRQDEKHATLLGVGIPNEKYLLILKSGGHIQWSTSRAQFALDEDDIFAADITGTKRRFGEVRVSRPESFKRSVQVQARKKHTQQRVASVHRSEGTATFNTAPPAEEWNPQVTVLQPKTQTTPPMPGLFLPNGQQMVRPSKAQETVGLEEIVEPEETVDENVELEEIALPTGTVDEIVELEEAAHPSGPEETVDENVELEEIALPSGTVEENVELEETARPSGPEETVDENVELEEVVRLSEPE